MDCKYLLIVLLLSIFMISSCSRDNEFYREKELLEFLRLNEVTFENKKSVLFFLVGSECGNCTEETKFLLSQIELDSIPNVTVVVGNVIAMTEYMNSISSFKRVIVTNSDTLAVRGLSFPSDMVFFFDGKKSDLQKYLEIHSYNRNEINKQLQKIKAELK